MTVSTIEHVTVVSVGPGKLDVSWRHSGTGPVHISIGPTPEAINLGRPVATIRDRSRITLSDLGAGRHYVAVAPVGGPPTIAAERLLPLEGPSNFRDLGGYPTTDGGRTRWGQLFRSDVPRRLSDADLSQVRQLGLRVAYDLRTDEERLSTPTALPDSVRREVLAIGGRAAHTGSNLRSMWEQSRDQPGEFLRELYRTLANDAAPYFGQLFRNVADSQSIPALIHCTAGKDRTGVAVALLLSALGVDESTVLDDYELSAVYFTERRMPQLLSRIPDAAAADIARYRAMFGAPREAMDDVLTTLRDQYGSITEYSISAADLDHATLERLRELLVAPAEASQLS